MPNPAQVEDDMNIKHKHKTNAEESDLIDTLDVISHLTINHNREKINVIFKINHILWPGILGTKYKN